MKCMAVTMTLALLCEGLYIHADAEDAPRPDAVQRHIQQLQHADPEVRRAAADALRNLADARAVEPLIACLRDESRDVRIGAAQALESLGYKPATEAARIGFLLAKEDWDQLLEVGPAAVEPLAAFLKNDVVPEVQAAGAVALTKLGTSVEPPKGFDASAAMRTAAILRDRGETKLALRYLQFVVDTHADTEYFDGCKLFASAYMQMLTMCADDPEKTKELHDILLSKRPNERFLFDIISGDFGETHPEIYSRLADKVKHAAQFIPLYEKIIWNYPDSWYGVMGSCDTDNYAYSAIQAIAERVADRSLAIATLRKVTKSDLPEDIRGVPHLNCAKVYLEVKDYVSAAGALKVLLQEHKDLGHPLTPVGDTIEYDLEEMLWTIPIAADGPAPPVPLTPGAPNAPGKACSDDSRKFTWSPVKGAYRYAVYVSKKPYGEENLVYTNRRVPGDASSCPFPSGEEGAELGPGEYRWNMRAFVRSRPTGYSNHLYFRIEAGG